MPPLKIEKKYIISPELQEFDIWELDFASFFDDVPENIRDICSYGFTEMVNNAINHSLGKNLTIWLNKTNTDISIMIYDDGIGIFNKIKQVLNLPNPKLAFLELAKGKLTTDPEHHTGQGVFFTSRIFDKFFIISSHLNFTSEIDFKEIYEQQLVEHNLDLGVGTLIGMIISLKQKRKLKDVFDKFAPPTEDYDFNKTIVPVKLAQYTKDKLISRSQAKRLVSRLENFKEVVFDFEEVDFIGPAFADEIFRIFARRYPHVKLSYINANNEIEAKIKAAIK